MAERELCTNGWGKAKVKYRSHAQAEKAARRSQSGVALHVYECRFCRGWHLTSQEQRNKAVTPPPSAAKLRRQLANAAAQIKATEKRLTAAERNYFDELDYVQRETHRIMAGRTK